MARFVILPKENFCRCESHVNLGRIYIYEELGSARGFSREVPG